MAINAIRSIGHARPIAPLETQREERIETLPPAGLADVEDRLESAFYDPIPPVIRPKLPVSIQIANLLDEQEMLTANALDLDNKRIRLSQGMLAKTNASIMEQINSRRLKESEVTLWGSLGQLVGYLSSAASLLTGGLLISTGTPFGIVSGGSLFLGALSSAASVFVFSYMDDPRLAGTLALLGAGLSMISGMLSWNDIGSALPNNSIHLLVNSALSVMNGVSMVGKSVMQSQLSYIDKLLIEQKEAARQSKADVERTQEDMKATVRQLTELTRMMKKNVEALERAKRQILQG